MKVLVMYTTHFGFEPKVKTIEDAEEITEGNAFKDCLVAFIQVEESDEEKTVTSREKKLVNHLKWTLRKNNCEKIVLHSFAHLSESKASLLFTKDIFDQAEIRLQNAGIKTAQTPFGYFLDLTINAPGYSLARIWTSL